MGPQAAINAVFYNQIQAIEDEAEREALRRREARGVRGGHRHPPPRLRAGRRRGGRARRPARRADPPLRRSRRARTARFAERRNPVTPGLEPRRDLSSEPVERRRPFCERRSESRAPLAAWIACAVGLVAAGAGLVFGIDAVQHADATLLTKSSLATAPSARSRRGRPARRPRCHCSRCWPSPAGSRSGAARPLGRRRRGGRRRRRQPDHAAPQGRARPSPLSGTARRRTARRQRLSQRPHDRRHLDRDRLRLRRPARVAPGGRVDRRLPRRRRRLLGDGARLALPERLSRRHPRRRGLGLRGAGAALRVARRRRAPRARSGLERAAPPSR